MYFMLSYVLWSVLHFFFFMFIFKQILIWYADFITNKLNTT